MLPVRMLTIGVHMLVSLVAVTPAASARSDGKLASTYEEAACDPSDSGECAPLFELSLSLPSAPAILDCNDARTSLLLADMIGTCDMPRRAHGVAAPPSVHPVGSAPAPRLSDGPRGSDSYPLRPPARGDDSPSLLTLRAPLAPALSASPLALWDSPLPLRAEDLRLDRPPRA